MSFVMAAASFWFLVFFGSTAVSGFSPTLLSSSSSSSAPFTTYTPTTTGTLSRRSSDNNNNNNIYGRTRLQQQHHHHSTNDANDDNGASAASSAPSLIINIDDSNYRTILKEAREANKLVLIDACAQWCGPCKLIEPAVKACAAKWQETVVVARFDVDTKCPDFKLELLMQNVLPRSLPSLILFHNLKALDSRKGVITEEELDEFLDAYHGPSEPPTTVVTNTILQTVIESTVTELSDGDYMLTDRSF